MSVVLAANAVKTRRKTEAAPSQAADGTWSMRLRQAGQDVWVRSHPSAKSAKAAAYAALAERTNRSEPYGRGPTQSLAAALCEYAQQTFPHKKGAPQEIRRLNVYLRAAGLHTVIATPTAVEAKGAYFKLGLQPWTTERVIPAGLGNYRNLLETKSADSQRLRAMLATKPVGKIVRMDVQFLVNKLVDEGCSAATVYQEVAILKAFFNHVRTKWNWPVSDNPASGLRMPKVDNKRERVLSKEERAAFEDALQESKNRHAALAMKFLAETAMRASEPLTDLRWGDINWADSTLRLRDSKTSARHVPLSAGALAVLHEMGPGEPGVKIFELTYEALKASFQRACARAGIEDAHLHDLRRTAATRLALKTGNIFIVQALTGHKTLSMVERYVNIKACDVVQYLNAPDTPVETAPSRLRTVRGQALSSTVSHGEENPINGGMNQGLGMSPDALAVIVQSAVTAALATQKSLTQGGPAEPHLKLAA